MCCIHHNYRYRTFIFYLNINEKENNPNYFLFKHLVLFASNNIVQQPISIYFKQYLCQKHAINNITNSYCPQCLHESSNNNIFEIDWNKMTLKSTADIDVSYELFQYLVDTYLSSEMLRNYYFEKNIPQQIIDDFSIRINDADLYYEYIDHLCIFHFLTKTSILQNVNCFINIQEDTEDEGKFIIKLLTKEKIKKGETLAILKEETLNQVLDNSCSFHIKYVLHPPQL
jgi:hypothetical protein